MNRILEIIFRRLVRFLILIILLPLVAVLVAYLMPRSYQTVTTIWALRPYQMIGATGAALDSQTNTPLTPAQTQVNTLIELLNTRDFAVTVTKGIPLASSLHLSTSVTSNPQLLDTALFQEISRHVVVTANGYDLFSISYTNHDPEVAQQVVEAVIQNYGLYIQKLSKTEGQNLLNTYQKQLVEEKQNLDAAITAESTYIASHPSLSKDALSADPGYAFLQSQTQQEESVYTDMLKNISTVQQEIASQSNGPASLFAVLDAPTPGQPVPRSTSIIIAGVMGLGLAIFASLLYVLFLARRDHLAYTALDVEKIIAIPVVMQLPSLTSTSVEML